MLDGIGVDVIKYSLILIWRGGLRVIFHEAPIPVIGRPIFFDIYDWQSV